MENVAIPVSLSASTRLAAARRDLSLTSWLVMLGATSILLGVLWDISWHMTIGRDTFWTPAHLAIYLGGTLGGIVCGALEVKTTFFGSDEEKARSVVLWGGRAPFGAWIVIWGAIAMITSAPFDDWWHNAYGLDVKIISPPHVLLFTGMFAVVIGAFLLVLRDQNTATDGEAAGARVALPYVGGVMVGMMAVLFTNDSWPNVQHTNTYYFVSCLIYPFILAAVARASSLRWAATLTAGCYMLLVGMMVWVLPLFAAHPKLGPIYIPLDHMTPPVFPHWLVVPAVIIDLAKQRGKMGRGFTRDWLISVFLGAGFLLLFVAVQWNFSEFLLKSPASRNWFFAGDHYWAYNSHPGDLRTEYWRLDLDALRLRGGLKAWLCGIVSVRVGLAWGNWMTRVKR